MNPPDLVFNSLSLSHATISDSAEAKECFEKFVEAISTAIADGICSPILRANFSIQDACICLDNDEKWHLDDWLSDSEVDRETRTLLLSLTSKVPVEDGFDLDRETEEQLLSQRFLIGSEDGPDCFEAGFSLYAGALICSIPSNQLWLDRALSIYQCSADSVLQSVATVDHVSLDIHVSALKAEQEQRETPSIIKSSDFIEHKEQVFSHLTFSPDVDDQVKHLTTTQVLNLVQKLKRMDQTCEKWSDSTKEKPNYQFYWRNESGATMANRKYVTARKFRLPSGDKAVFESHADFSDSHRIHFIEDAENKSFVIGYIGNHLPTVKYN